MSVEPLICSDCNVTCEYETVGPFPEGAESGYGVSWQCPRCEQRSLDVCPIGPLVPTKDTCLNCGGSFSMDSDEPMCESCGLSRLDAEASLQVASLPSDVDNTIRAAFHYGRFRFGLAVANKALMADPSLEEAWVFKTTFLSALGFDQSLAEVLKHMIKLGIGSATISFGSLLYRQGMYDEAVNVYREFLEARPNDGMLPAVMSNLANALHAIGSDAEAEQLYRTAIEREPTRATHYVNYVLLLMNQGRIEDALNCIDTGLEASPENEHAARLLEDRSFLCAEQNRGEDALESIEEALSLGAQGIRPRYLHGRALALVGRLEEARDEIQLVLDADPSNEDAIRAIRLIDQALQG